MKAATAAKGTQPLPRQSRSPQPASNPDVVSIDALLEAAGLDTAPSKEAGRVVLAAAGLTSGRKQNMALEKKDAAATLLAKSMRPLCPDCAATPQLRGRDRRQVVEVAGPTCDVCGGRSVARALLMVGRTLGRKGLRKLLIVGGSPATHDEVRRGLAPFDLDLTLISGESTQNANRATALAEAADVIVIWGSSILAHKTSANFQKPEYRWKTVVMSRRGIEALGQELVKHLAGR